MNMIVDFGNLCGRVGKKISRQGCSTFKKRLLEIYYNLLLSLLLFFFILLLIIIINITTTTIFIIHNKINTT